MDGYSSNEGSNAPRPGGSSPTSSSPGKRPEQEMGVLQSAGSEDAQAPPLDALDTTSPPPSVPAETLSAASQLSSASPSDPGPSHPPPPPPPSPPLPPPRPRPPGPPSEPDTGPPTTTLTIIDIFPPPPQPTSDPADVVSTTTFITPTQPTQDGGVIPSPSSPLPQPPRRPLLPPGLRPPGRRPPFRANLNDNNVHAVGLDEHTQDDPNSRGGCFNCEDSIGPLPPGNVGSLPDSPDPAVGGGRPNVPDREDDNSSPTGSSDPSDPTDDDGNGRHMKIAAPLTVAVLLVGLFVGWFVLRRRKRNKRRQAGQEEAGDDTGHETQQPMQGLGNRLISFATTSHHSTAGTDENFSPPPLRTARSRAIVERQSTAKDRLQTRVRSSPSDTLEVSAGRLGPTASTRLEGQEASASTRKQSFVLTQNHGGNALADSWTPLQPDRSLTQALVSRSVTSLQPRASPFWDPTDSSSSASEPSDAVSSRSSRQSSDLRDSMVFGDNVSLTPLQEYSSAAEQSQWFSSREGSECTRETPSPWRSLSAASSRQSGRATEYHSADDGRGTEGLALGNGAASHAGPSSLAGHFSLSDPSNNPQGVSRSSSFSSVVFSSPSTRSSIEFASPATDEDYASPNYRGYYIPGTARLPAGSSTSFHPVIHSQTNDSGRSLPLDPPSLQVTGTSGHPSSLTSTRRVVDTDPNRLQSRQLGLFNPNSNWMAAAMSSPGLRTAPAHGAPGSPTSLTADMSRRPSQQWEKGSPFSHSSGSPTSRSFADLRTSVSRQ